MQVPGDHQTLVLPLLVVLSVALDPNAAAPPIVVDVPLVYVNGPVPPLVCTVMVPLLPPLHDTGVVLTPVMAKVPH